MPFDEIVESSTPTRTPVPTAVTSFSNIEVWPWPRILMTEFHIFALTVQSVGNLFISELTLDSGNVTLTGTSDIGLAEEISQVDVADFGPFYVVTTYGRTTDVVPLPVIRTFYKDIVANILVPFSTPAMGTCCVFNGQFIGGNVLTDTSGIHGDLDSDGLVWSAIANFEFDPTVDITAGFRRLEFPNNIGRRPTIYKIIRHHSGVVVYSDAGRIFLEPEYVDPAVTYSLRVLKGLGVASGNHVAGDKYIQGFIDLYGDFWTWELPHANLRFDGGVLKKLGYRDYIKNMLDFSSEEDSRVIVSYVDKNKRFYISNGQECLIINEFGACSIFQCASSVIVGYDGKLYGTFRNTVDTEARIVSDEVDFGTRSLKSIESIIGGVSSGQKENIHFALDWRTVDSQEFKRTAWKPVGPRGEAVLKVTASSFRICVRITNYIDAQIAYLGLNVKYPDNRFKRGPTADAGNLVSTRGAA